MVRVELDLPADEAALVEAAKESQKKEDEEKTGIKLSGGKKTGGILKAPFALPEIEKLESRRGLAEGQVRSLFLGFAFVMVALIAWPVFGWQVALAVALVGTTLISVGTLIRI